MITELCSMWPFNLAKSIFESGELAMNLYIPGLMKALDDLSERERDILVARFRDGVLLKDLADRYEVSRERIRQLEERSIIKLQRPKTKRKLTAVSQDSFMELERTLRTVRSEIPVRYFEHELINLGLSTRSYNALRRAGITCAQEIAMMTYDELMAIRNLGVNSVNEIADTLRDLGFTLRSENCK